ncbi:hypothetical protein [Novosphingobium sp.]|uniref:hypothetical protein n=1 Tax=Novosphingobium sp. TaxID=1874826 RepID=UPI003D151CA8
MVDAFGGGSGQGIWTQRDSFIATEIGLILFLREMKLSIVPADTIKILDELAGLLPTQTVRSEEQIALQYFFDTACTVLAGRAHGFNRC